MRLPDRLFAPDFAQKLTMSQDLAGVSDEQTKERIFDGSEFNSRLFQDDTFDRSTSEFDAINGVGSWLGVAQGGAEAGEEFGAVEGFGDVIIGAGIKRGDFFLLLVRTLRMMTDLSPFPDAFEDLNAFDIR